jgi:hypothetical protein
MSQVRQKRATTGESCSVATPSRPRLFTASRQFVRALCQSHTDCTTNSARVLTQHVLIPQFQECNV